jgi:hypothetical protein
LELSAEYSIFFASFILSNCRDSILSFIRSFSVRDSIEMCVSVALLYSLGRPRIEEFNMRLYVGNLSRDVTEAELREVFQPFGKIDELTIVKDRFNNVSKGFGFVEMPEQSEAQAAIAGLQGKELKGRSLDVNEARPQADRSSRGRSGGYKGGGGGRRGGSGGRSW